TNGSHAGVLCLAVRTGSPEAGPKGISLLIIEPKGLPGYSVGPPLEKVGLHAQDTCELFFKDVRVPATSLLGPSEGRGLSQLMEMMGYERLSIGVSAVATAEQAVATTAKYVSQRTAFGKRLIDFQNTRFKLAECKTEARVARVFVDDCIQRSIAGQL